MPATPPRHVRTSRIPFIVAVFALLAAICPAWGDDYDRWYVLKSDVWNSLWFVPFVVVIVQVVVTRLSEWLGHWMVAKGFYGLETRYLGNRNPNLHFALLTDPPDSAQPFEVRFGEGQGRRGTEGGPFGAVEGYEGRELGTGHA